MTLYSGLPRFWQRRSLVLNGGFHEQRRGNMILWISESISYTDNGIRLTILGIQVLGKGWAFWMDISFFPFPGKKVPKCLFILH